MNLDVKLEEFNLIEASSTQAQSSSPSSSDLYQQLRRFKGSPGTPEVSDHPR